VADRILPGAGLRAEVLAVAARPSLESRGSLASCRDSSKARAPPDPASRRRKWNVCGREHPFAQLRLLHRRRQAMPRMRRSPHPPHPPQHGAKRSRIRWLNRVVIRQLKRGAECWLRPVLRGLHPTAGQLWRPAAPAPPYWAGGQPRAVHSLGTATYDRPHAHRCAGGASSWGSGIQAKCHSCWTHPAPYC
jgi:hypothetical protein